MSSGAERPRSPVAPDSAVQYFATLDAGIGAASRVLWIGQRNDDIDRVRRQGRRIETLSVPVATIAHDDAGAVSSASSSTVARFHLSSKTYDAIVFSLVDTTILGAIGPAAGDALADGGRLVIGCANASSLTVALSLLGPATSARSQRATGGSTLPMLTATLAAAGYVIESVRIVRSIVDDQPEILGAAHELDELLATSPHPNVDYYVIVARPGERAAAVELARQRLTDAVRPAPTHGGIDPGARTALLQREQQLEAINGTFGWRLLSRYGPYKQRFVVPAWRAIRGGLQRFVVRAGTRQTTPYEAWARFSDRFRGPAGIVTAGGSSGSDARADALVSVIVTVGDASPIELAATVTSLIEQRHPHWQLCLAPVGERGAATVRSVLARLGTSDSRITLDRSLHATHADAATAAVALGTGNLIATLPPGVALASDALLAAVRALVETAGDVVYCDEDLRDENGRRHSPQLRSGWSPDLLLSGMYWSRFVLYRRTVVEQAGGFRSEYDDALHYDLALRMTEHRARIVHLPRILAHATTPPSMTGGSGTAAARDAGRRALDSALERRGIAGSVRWHVAGDVYRVQRAVIPGAKVTIIVPTRDHLSMLQRCLLAVEATDHSSYEVVIVDNGSVDDATLAFLEQTRHTVMRSPGPFNFARLNNRAVRQTDGDYLVFLNNDTEACSSDWLRALEEHAQRPEVGAVGAKLLYPNGRIQHAGIAIGIGGLAGHPYRFQRGAPEAIRNVSAVTAACLMMRRETFDAIGGFDERLPVNSNDVDLCLRLRARGYLVVYTPHAVLYHHESATRGLRATPDDAWLMARRWRPALLGDPYYSPNADLAAESGEVDLSKPDGFVCLYAGPAKGGGPVQVGPGATLGQRFFAVGADVCAIVVRIRGCGDGTAPALRLTLRDAPESVVDVRTVEQAIHGRSNGELWFCFEPIPSSANRYWYFFIEPVDDRIVTAERAAFTSDVMGPCFENHAPAHGTLLFQLYARAPHRCATSPP